MSDKCLKPSEKDFFFHVYEAVLANPFSDERAETDLKIAGMFPGVSRDKVIEKTIAEVRNRIQMLSAEGRCSLNNFSNKDREILLASFLFDIFQRSLVHFLSGYLQSLWEISL